MSRSSGPGWPIAARCSQCRKRDNGRHSHPDPAVRRAGRLDRMVLTGRRRLRPSQKGHPRVDRMHVYEYHCIDCRHTGWTRHADVARLYDPMRFRVQARMCASCIYRPDSSLDIKQLEAAVADPKMEGHFRGHRECHHAPRGSGICCRGFWEAHKDSFDAGQLAQRLGVVTFVDVDVSP